MRFIKFEAVAFQHDARVRRLFPPLLGKVDVYPSRKALARVPLALAVSQ
jgi:hypothetical protein